MSAQELKKMMAKKMMSHKFKTGSKSLSHEWFKAKVNKKKLPNIPAPKKQDSEYKRMSMEEYEAKYPN